MIDEVAGLLGGLERLLAGAPSRRTICSVTVEVAPEVDPCAEAFALRRADDRWFCWEQPDSRFALGGVGSAAELISRGPGRFGDLAGEAASLVNGRLSDEPLGLPAGAGPVWTGGMAFDEAGGSQPQWHGLPPGLLVLPELSLAGTDGRAWLTAALLVGPGIDPEGALRSIRSRLEVLGGAGHAPLDPAPTGRFSIRSVRPPHEFEAAVAAATARIRSSALEKVVLAREVVVQAPRAHDPGSVFGALRELFPSCFCFCVGTPEGSFLGASPELLVRRRGAGAATVALAGSTRRSADPAVDDHLGEQLLRSSKDREEHEIVARRIERTLRPHAVWVEADRDPGIVKVANIQHLATPIHAQLSQPRSAVALAGLLHPTPAVGGEPWPAAREAIAELEEMDRGWYAAPVGWMDSAEDGEFCVGLRSALLRDRTAHVYAGVGIVADSDPASELAETELKLGAMLPLLSG